MQYNCCELLFSDYYSKCIFIKYINEVFITLNFILYMSKLKMTKVKKPPHCHVATNLFQLAIAYQTPSYPPFSVYSYDNSNCF